MSVNRVLSDGSTQLIAGATLWADLGVGCIVPFGGDTNKIMAGWLLCDGSELTKTEYAELYAVIGDSFGTASVNTKFVLPDLREATTKGVGLTGKSNNHYDSDGLALGEFIDDRVKKHLHGESIRDSQPLVKYSSSSGSAQNGYRVGGESTSDNQEQLTTSYAGYDTNEVKAVGVNFIIKAKQVALPADLEAQVETKLNELQSGFTTVQLSSGVGVIDLSDKFSSITSCVVCQNYTDYVVQYCKPDNSNNSAKIEFKISRLDGSVNSYSYGVNWFACGVPK